MLTRLLLLALAAALCAGCASRERNIEDLESVLEREDVRAGVQSAVAESRQSDADDLAVVEAEAGAQAGEAAESARYARQSATRTAGALQVLVTADAETPPQVVAQALRDNATAGLEAQIAAELADNVVARHERIAQRVDRMQGRAAREAEVRRAEAEAAAVNNRKLEALLAREYDTQAGIEFGSALLQGLTGQIPGLGIVSRAWDRASAARTPEPDPVPQRQAEPESVPAADDQVAAMRELLAEFRAERTPAPVVSTGPVAAHRPAPAAPAAAAPAPTPIPAPASASPALPAEPVQPAPTPAPRDGGGGGSGDDLIKLLIALAGGAAATKYGPRVARAIAGRGSANGGQLAAGLTGPAMQTHNHFYDPSAAAAAVAGMGASAGAAPSPTAT